MKRPPDPAPLHYQTDLAQTPLPEILVKIQRYNVPGRLELRHQDHVDVLHVDRGALVSASAPLEETLPRIFSWNSGSIAFVPGRVTAHLTTLETPVPIREAILRGASSMPDARMLLARIGTRSTLLQRTELALDIALSRQQQVILDGVNGKRSLSEIVNLPGSPGDNARILYALFVLGFVRERLRKHIKVQLKTKTTPA